MALTQKEISARHYRNRKENGLCPRCGKPMDRDGYYCSDCLAKHREYQKENREFFRQNHICTECGKEKVPKGERICPECRAKRELYRKPKTSEQKIKARNHQKDLYKERKETGICTRCGKRKALPEKLKCGICLEKDAEIHRIKYMGEISIREYRKKNKLCYFCGNKIDLDSGNICKKCHEKFKNNGKRNGGNNDYWKQQNNLIFGGK